MERDNQMTNNSNSSDITDEIRGYMAQCPQSFPLCKDVNRYQRLMKIGQGTFGEVFKAKHRKTKKIVALKKIKMEQEKEGFPITALREIKILQTLNHVNIVNLRRICCLKPSEANRFKPEFYLVFDFADHDLAGLLSNSRIKMDLSEIKSILKQLFTAIFYLHDNNVLHRDMKAANILLTREGVLKLADFGLARVFTPPDDERTNRYTARVVTLWYRPPELLLGERNYGPPIDMWGAGCIMTELWTRCPIMQGDTEYKQLMYIVNLCGSITPSVWPDVVKLEHYKKFSLPDTLRRRVKERLKLYIPDSQALDLIDSLLTLDPSKRATAEHALMHDFFFEEPMAGDLSLLFKKHPDVSFFEFLTPRNRPDRVNLFDVDNSNPAPGPSSQSAMNRRNATLNQQHEQKDQQAFERAF